MRLAVMDLVNDGNAPPNPVELAVVPVLDGRPRRPRVWTVRPPRPIHWRATKDHGLRDDDVAGSPAIEEIWRDVVDELQAADAVVLHGAAPRLELLARAVLYAPPVVIDTQVVAQRILPGFGTHALGPLCLALGLIPTHQPLRRRAEPLALAVAALLGHLLERDPGLVARALGRDYPQG